MDVVRSGAEEGLLRDRGVRADRNASDGIAVDVVAQTGAFAHFKIPGCPDADAGHDAGPGSDTGAKEAEQEAPPGIGRPRSGTEQHQGDDLPERAAEPVDYTVRTRAIVSPDAYLKTGILQLH